MKMRWGGGLEWLSHIGTCVKETTAVKFKVQVSNQGAITSKAHVSRCSRGTANINANQQNLGVPSAA
jgi:hypothetical protein